jgi:hypothetical protein
VTLGWSPDRVEVGQQKQRQYKQHAFDMQLDGWDWHPNNGFVLGAAYAMIDD